jgi:hypothetical protein
VRVISPQATGAPDIFWFAKIAGPVARMQDLHSQAVSFSTRGSLSNFILLTPFQEAGVDDARLVSIGAADNGYPVQRPSSMPCGALFRSPYSILSRAKSGSSRAAMIHRECTMRRFGSTPSTRTF